MNSTDILQISPEDRVSISVKNLSITVKGDNKVVQDIENVEPVQPKILDDVSFDLSAGNMMAIMGGSGSGKTTLLNTLSQRLNIKNTKLLFDGTIEYFSGNEQISSEKRIKNSYLQQSDHFFPGLTVYETLKYQADLRLPPSVSPEEKINLINTLLDILDLSHRKDDIIRSFTDKINLSGGEQRRVSLAIQLLNKPSVLFLDEPTTGLDTSTSWKLVKTLKTLASPQFGITVILSIHQPRPEITMLFDKICLLTRGGRIVYYGNLVDSSNHFSFLGNTFLKSSDTSHNIISINYIMALSIKDDSSREKEIETSKNIDRMVEVWKSTANSPPHNKSPKEIQKLANKNLTKFQRVKLDQISLFREIVVLTKRTFKCSYRDKASLIALNGGSILLGFACGWMFYNPKPDLAGIRSRTSTLYVVLEVIGFAPMFIEIERLFSYDGDFFIREYKERYVSVTGFLVSRRLAKLLLEDLPVPILFTVITYFMWGLRLTDTTGGSDSTCTYFFIQLAITILANFISMSSALTMFAASPDFAISTLIVNVFYQLQNSACGYFVNAATMPVYVRWTKYLAYFWYAFGALTANQFTDWTGDCPYADADKCTEYTGNYQLNILGYPKNWIAEPIGILVAWFFGFNILSFIFFHLRSFELNVAKTKQNRIGEEEEENAAEEQDNKSDSTSDTMDDPFEENYQSEIVSKDVEDIGISLHDINLSVKVKEGGHFWNRKTSSRTLLENVSANFKANEVNVIMGPSGGGKTTLLSFIAARLSKAFSFKTSGLVKLNHNQIVTPQLLSSVSAFVTQHDHSLIPKLTVRETLYYQAKLRMPTEEHDTIPGVINKLIRQTGLLDCADTLVGSSLVKGISGGEKRRVSIAIQLLGKPKVLFLDEPTSGLDSSTSVAIMNLLDDLAKLNKTTIILTIHQPSEDMFKKFGTVLLLAKGGRVIFNGKTSELEGYLGRIGHPPLHGMNIADFMLDLVSVGPNESQVDAEGRVQRLITEWHGSQVDSDKLLTYQESPHDVVDLKKHQNVKAPFWSSFWVISNRQLLASVRSIDIFAARALQILCLGIIHLLYFTPLKNGQDGISNRLGLVQEVLNLYYVGLINNITLYPIEREIFYQEYKDNVYGVLAFSGAYLVNEVPVELVCCFVFAIFVVFGAGLPRNAGMFFSMFFTSFVSVNTGDSLGIFFNSVFSHLGLSVNLLSITCILAIFMGGTMSLHMPEFFQAWNYLSPMKYAVGICANLGFRDQTFACGLGTTSCVLDSGERVLEYYHLTANVGVYFGALVACLIVYRAIAVSAIFVRVKWLQ